MKENRWSTTQFDRPPMTKPRTLEEIAEEWFKIHDGMCVRSIDGQPYREHFLAALLASREQALREERDEARVALQRLRDDRFEKLARLSRDWQAAEARLKRVVEHLHAVRSRHSDTCEECQNAEAGKNLCVVDSFAKAALAAAQSSEEGR